MWYVSPALVAEGSTDIRFLGTLISRTLSSLLARSSNGNYELADVVPIGRATGLPSPEQVVERLTSRETSAYSLVFVHRDSDARDTTASDAWIALVRDRLTARELQSTVFIVPVKMMEAWAMVDGEAIRKALGVTWADSEVGVPQRARDVEDIREPKSAIRAILKRVSGPQVDLFARLADRIDLLRLADVPAYRRFESETKGALVEQGVIGGKRVDGGS